MCSMRKNITFRFFLFLFAIPFVQLRSQCTPIGSVTASGFNNVTNIGLVNWSNAGAASSSDDVRSVAGAVVGALNVVSTNYLTGTNFYFPVPPSAFVCGVQVSIEHRQNAGITGGWVHDNVVQLQMANQLIGVNKASSVYWTGNDEVFVYGGPFDSWGANLTPSVFNSPAFGLVVSATLRGGLSAALVTAEIDAISMTIYYTMPLPIEFSNFVAKDSGGAVALHWQTASESSTDHFAIERSQDAVSFIAIGALKGGGNGQETGDYNFLDVDPLPGQAYYRIKQVDYSGNAQYSDIQAVTYVHKASLIAAGIVNGSFVLKMYAPVAMPVAVQVSDITGRQVKDLHQEIGPGSGEIRIGAENLESGIYFIRASLAGEECIRKVYLIREE